MVAYARFLGNFSYSIDFFWGEFGPGQLTSFISSLVKKLDFISQPSSKSTLPFLQDYSICNNARLISTQFLLQAIDPNEWCLKNGLLNGGLNPQPLSHESSALTTRPRLLAIIVQDYSINGKTKNTKQFFLFEKNEEITYSVNKTDLHVTCID